uniref:E3 ubiquitin-protein ligase Ubr3-like n=1 Tax=Diabrotica virgifera virgifera TaxID=50390 RepID=A0A6P7HB18_DIAVI
MVRSRPKGNMSHILEELNNLLIENDRKPNTMKMAEAIGKVMEDMSNSTQLKARFKFKNEKPIIHNLQSLLLFVTSIARTNLEVELIQRGGSLVQFSSGSTLLPKRDCIGMLTF